MTNESTQKKLVAAFWWAAVIDATGLLLVVVSAVVSFDSATPALALAAWIVAHLTTAIVLALVGTLVVARGKAWARVLRTDNGHRVIGKIFMFATLLFGFGLLVEWASFAFAGDADHGVESLIPLRDTTIWMFLIDLSLCFAVAAWWSKSQFGFYELAARREERIGE